MTQIFRVFLKDGSHVDVDADTYVRDGPDWVLYRGFDMATAQEAARYSSALVNAIALHGSPRVR
jgi:hypothetical protein